MVKSWRFWAVVAAALALGGWAYKKHAGADASDAAAPVSVERGDLEKHFVDSGEIAPKNYVDVASQVSGRVVTMTVDEGSRVKKGDELCVIQPGRSEAERYVPTSVRAPIDGIVMRYQKQGSNEPSTLARMGDYVTGLVESNSPTYLMTVADLSRLVVRMKISEMDVLKLRAGMPVKVTVDAIPNETLPAQVSVVSPQAEKDSNGIKSFRVDVALEKNDARLKPGMTARVDGLLEARHNVLKIPLSAVFEENGKEIAYSGAPEDREKPRKIALKLGLRNETDAEVLEGPKPGEKLLTEKPVDKPAS
ncbi:MAG TPA: efflux RND transporter periplasmic adaptor subunit [Elusimicrobiota bacterium]|nr:efflux RND transporter periplasmic adaptor subunit [Elusimicrobiota bacterium]